LVSAYDSDIIEQLQDCNAFMWHHSHLNYKDRLFANSLLHSLELSRKRVFPDSNTNWHFDDKIAQKYLLEAIGASFVPTYMFFSRREADTWIRHADFPKVFKLRGGAGSQNVRLVDTRREAYALSRQAFGRGFSRYSPLANLKERYRKYRLGKTTLTQLAKGVLRLVYPPPYARLCGREIGYLYFQDFIPDNTFDIRIIVIGNRAFGIKRMARKNDFRASGSGSILYKRDEIDERCVTLAFNLSSKFKSQCMGYDFVFDRNGNPLVVEMSYGFTAQGYDPCEGYWDSDLTWHEGPFDPYGWMIEDLVKDGHLTS